MNRIAEKTRYNKQGVLLLDPTGYHGGNPVSERARCQHNYSCKDHRNNPIVLNYEDDQGLYQVMGEMCLLPGCGRKRRTQ